MPIPSASAHPPLTRTRLLAELRAIGERIQLLERQVASMVPPASGQAPPRPAPQRPTARPPVSRGPARSPRRAWSTGRRAPASTSRAVANTTWPTPCRHCAQYCNPQCPCTCHHETVRP